MNHQNWTGFRKTLSSFHHLPPNLTLGNAAMVLESVLYLTFWKLVMVWQCGTSHSYSCERSRRNGGRWWPQVRERWCGCFRNLPHAGDCVKLVQQISGRSIALKVIFDLTEDSLDCFSRIVAGWWDPQGLSPYDQGTPLQVWAPTGLVKIEELRVVEGRWDHWQSWYSADTVLKIFWSIPEALEITGCLQTPNSSV